MKLNQLKLLEDLYNFLGTYEDLLKSEYKKIKKVTKDKNFNYQQFCITFYSHINGVIK